MKKKLFKIIILAIAICVCNFKNVQANSSANIKGEVNTEKTVIIKIEIDNAKEFHGNLNFNDNFLGYNGIYGKNDWTAQFNQDSLGILARSNSSNTTGEILELSFKINSTESNDSSVVSISNIEIIRGDGSTINLDDLWVMVSIENNEAKIYTQNELANIDIPNNIEVKEFDVNNENPDGTETTYNGIADIDELAASTDVTVNSEADIVKENAELGDETDLAGESIEIDRIESSDQNESSKEITVTMESSEENDGEGINDESVLQEMLDEYGNNIDASNMVVNSQEDDESTYRADIPKIIQSGDKTTATNILPKTGLLLAPFIIIATGIMGTSIYIIYIKKKNNDFT